MSKIDRIQALYAAEEGHRQDKVFTADQVPLSYDAITDEWLTATLCTTTPGARVVGHWLDVVDSGSSNRRKIAVEYNVAGQQAGLETALFCKATHDLPNRILLGLSKGAYSEVTFYNEMRPLLDIEAPLSLFARFDSASCNSIVVLRDISRQVTSFCDHHTDVTRARAESQIALLATLHGRVYQSEAIRSKLALFETWPQFFENTLQFGLRDACYQGFADAEAVIPSAIFARSDEIWPLTLASVERHRALPHTLCHGDVHLKNWYIAGDGRMGLSDWQCVHSGHWARDFAYAVASGLTVENRRAWETDLLRLYLEHMRAAGGPDTGFDEGWLHYRQQLMTALAWWTVTLSPAPDMPDMQPRDITLEFIRRISIAIDDVGSLRSFG